MKIRIVIVFVFFVVGFVKINAQISVTERQMEKEGMVDIHTVDQSIYVSLMYGRADNFTGKRLYTDLTHAYLHPKAAKALARAQKYLQKEHPEWSLIIFDACRPMHIQQKMWNVVKGTKVENYVSNPARGGGLHNYGMAVDISLCNLKGDTLKMGSKVDHMSKLSHIDQEYLLLKHHQISSTALENRQLLRRIMRKAGFRPLRTEWWHFNLISRATAKKYYKYVK
ncbi:MAG: M15 family metallopeptidase [Bacteroidaceae bacterium]